MNVRSLVELTDELRTPLAGLLNSDLPPGQDRHDRSEDRRVAAIKYHAGQLLKWVEQLVESHGAAPPLADLGWLPTAATLTAAAADVAFLSKLRLEMERYLDDSRFGVEAMADNLGISRAHLYRRVKALTGLTATELLRQYRLKRSVEYLQMGCSVAEAGHLVGFDTPSYFSKCFRQHYQCTPTEYVASLSRSQPT